MNGNTLHSQCRTSANTAMVVSGGTGVSSSDGFSLCLSSAQCQECSDDVKRKLEKNKGFKIPLREREQGTKK